MSDINLDHILLQLGNKDTVSYYIELCTYTLENDFDIRYYIGKTSHRSFELVYMDMSYRIVFPDDRMVQNYGHDWRLKSKENNKKIM